MVIEDAEIIQKILAGDRNQYSELVRRNEGRVYRLCLGILGDPHEAEEAAQETFLKAYKALARFQGDSAFSTWLTRIGINHCRDVLRRRRRRTFLSLDFLLEKNVNPPRPLVTETAPEPEGLDQARAVLGALSPGDREILVLKEVENLSYGEIGELLGVTLDGVKGRLKRARERVRHILKETDV